MSKDKSIFSEVTNIYILYKLRWVILVGIIFFVAIYFIVSSQVNKEYQQYGYTGISDNIKYDEFTGEIIPKNQITTYDNSSKYIINSKGNKITFAQIQEQLDKYESIQGSYASFNSDKVNLLDDICNTLLREYLDLNYEIVPFGGTVNQFRFQIKGEYEKSYYAWFSTSSDLKGLVKEVIKEKYKNDF